MYRIMEIGRAVAAKQQGIEAASSPEALAFLEKQARKRVGVVLGSALGGEAALGEWIDWTQRPMVKFAEWILVLLLAAHLTGGLRLLALEFLPWRNWQKTLAAIAAGASLAVMLIVALAR